MTVSYGLVICRGVQFASALLAFGVPAFEALVVGPCARRVDAGVAVAWRGMARRLTLVAFPLVLLSGIGWFIYSAADMTGVVPQAVFSSGKALIVWRLTHFGLVCRVRLTLWAAGVLVWGGGLMAPLGAPRLKAFLAAATTLLTAALLASLAWIGHAGAQGPLTPRVALDALHLLVAGLWPAGLLPLLWLLLHLRRAAGPDAGSAMAFLVLRFSNLSLLAVGLLLATGVAQISYLPSMSGWIAESYGLLLGAKLALVGVLVMFGAFNRFRFMLPLLDGNSPREKGSPSRLLVTLAAELLLTAAIIGLVSILGIASPGASS